jgi:hypothetical protein
VRARTRSDRTGADPPDPSARTPLPLSEMDEIYDIGVPDPEVLKPPGSGSVSQRYGPGARSFTLRPNRRRPSGSVSSYSSPFK